jgi:hypothetical protein
MSDFIFSGKRANGHGLNPNFISILRRITTQLLGVRYIFDIDSNPRRYENAQLEMLKLWLHF